MTHSCVTYIRDTADAAAPSNADACYVCMSHGASVHHVHDSFVITHTHTHTHTYTHAHTHKILSLSHTHTHTHTAPLLSIDHVHDLYISDMTHSYVT